MEVNGRCEPGKIRLAGIRRSPDAPTSRPVRLMPMNTSAAPACPAPVDPKSFTRFADFYPFYLGEHQDRTCRRLHFVGSTLALACLAMLVATGKPQYLLYGLDRKSVV